MSNTGRATRRASDTRGWQPLTGLARVPARDLRARLLVVDEPLLEAAHDTPPVVEGCIGPSLLRVVGILDFLGNFSGGVRHDGVEVICRRGIISRDVLSSLEGYSRKETIRSQMRLEPGLWQLLCCPCLFDLLLVVRAQ